MMAAVEAVQDSGTNSSVDSGSAQHSPEFKDPLGVNDPLHSAVDDESDEFDFDYYLSQISPTSSNKLELDGITIVNSGRNNCHPVTISNLGGELDTDEHDLFVHVDNPEKHVTAMETYITFRVITKTTRSDLDSNEYQVRRRYNDFLWLRQRLEETQSTHIIPPLPQKHSLKRLDRFNQEFVRTRMIALQNFLQRIADHPVLSFNKHFYTFLTTKQWEFQAAKKEGAGVMSRLANSFHSVSAAYMMKNRPTEFENMTTYINTFAEKLASTDRVSQRILKEQYDLLSEFNEWGPVFTLWSNSEDRLSVTLSAVAKSIEKCYVALQELIDANEAQFSNPLKEYILYADAVKSVLRRRDVIQMEYDMLLEELCKKKETSDELTRQVEVLNDKLTCANADLEADIERWHINKRKDFRKLFVNMADRQICYYQKCLEAWEEVVPKIKKADVSSDDVSRTSPKCFPSTRSS